MKKIVSFITLGLCFYSLAFAQDSTVVQEEASEVKPSYTRATFKSTKLINMQTTELTPEGNMQFMISHHFSNIWNKDAGSDNIAQLFGFNSGVANTYLSFDYTPVHWGNIGLAASGDAKFEGWLKFKLLRQQTGTRNIPVTLSWFSLANFNAGKSFKTDVYWNRFNYMHQLLIARKFSDKLSLQLMPTMVHINIVPHGNENNIFSMGMAGRYKLTSNKALTFEYSRQLNMYEYVFDKSGNMIHYVPDLLSLGLEFNTGNHVFQFFIGSTNFASNIDQLSRNTNSLKDWQFALGFNLNRYFTIKD